MITLGMNTLHKLMLSAGDSVANKYKQLVGMGVTFELEFYKVKATSPPSKIDDAVVAQKQTSWVLPYSAQKAANHQLKAFEQEVMAAELTAFLQAVFDEFFVTYQHPSGSVTIPIPAGTLKDETPVPKFLKNKKPGHQPTNTPVMGEDPVPLSKATEIGQRVKATTHIYRVIGLGDRAALAARNVGNGVASVRLEFRDHCFASTADVAAISAVGLGNNGSYYSMHVALNGVPLRRYLGAVLFDLGSLLTEVIKPDDLPKVLDHA